MVSLTTIFVAVTACSWIQVSLCASITIPWTSISYAGLSVQPGTTINFEYTMHRNLFLFANKEAYNSCDFAEGSIIGEPSEGYAPGKAYTFAEEGVFYFGSGLGDSCKRAGQKLAVTVTSGAPAEPEAPVVLQDGVQQAPATAAEWGQPGEDIFYWDFVLDDVEVAAERTSSITSGMLIEYSTELNIIGFEPLTRGRFLQRMILSGCTSTEGVSEKVDYGGEEGESPVTSCEDALWSWAPGVGVMLTPPEAAFRVGPNDTQALHLVAHYDNALLEEGATDSSSFRIYYTPTVEVRPHKMGVLRLGSEAELGGAIEAGLKQAYSTSSCLFAPDAPSAVTIAGYTVHAHLIARAIRVEQHRMKEGRKMDHGSTPKNMDLVQYIAEEDPFLFDKQYYSADPEVLPLLPGDIVSTTCVYDSRDRNDATVGGPGALDEVCAGYVTYYPKVEGGQAAACELVQSPQVGMLALEEEHPESFLLQAHMDGLLGPFAEKDDESMDWALMFSTLFAVIGVILGVAFGLVALTKRHNRLANEDTSQTMSMKSYQDAASAYLPTEEIHQDRTTPRRKPDDNTVVIVIGKPDGNVAD